MRTGRLRELVTVERRKDAATKYRRGSEDWQPVAARRPASIEPLRGSENLVAQRLEGRAIFEITIRNESALIGLDSGWRVVDARAADRVFDIKHVAASARGAWLTILCEQSNQETGD